MPELPEVELVRRSLEARLVGRAVRRATLIRADMVSDGPTSKRAMLEGAVVAAVQRHGKQLAIVASDGRVLSAHLGMTGAFLVLPAGSPADALTHVHATWRLDDGGVVVYRDPRRFGWLRPLADLERLGELWASLGPDALTLTATQLSGGLRGTRRTIKAALLDQRVVAGVGNIYADELLHAAGVSPAKIGCGPSEVKRIAAETRKTLLRAIRAGGSTIRDFVSADGGIGSYQRQHAVYGRGGAPCRRCGSVLLQTTIAQRATVWCPSCQAT